MSKVDFHLRLDKAVCVDLFPDEWLTVYCELVVDSYALQFYDILVKKEPADAACAELGLCPQARAQPLAANRRGATSLPPDTANKAKAGDDGGFAFAVLSDMHIGESEYVSWLSTKAIALINSLVDAHDIKMVFVTGDITNSAMYYQWSAAKGLLDQLKVPYFPTFGNHDVWSYNATFEEPKPTGDRQFAQTFGDALRNGTLQGATLVKNEDTSFDPQLNVTCLYQNWELTYNGMAFYGLDWNSREHAATELGDKGAWPAARLHNYTHGTLPWLKERLQALPRSIKTVTLFQHHPFAMPFFIPGWFFSFSDADLAAVKSALYTEGSGLNYWGLIAGHLHTWFSGNGFSADKSSAPFKQWLTEATKVAAGVTLVEVDADGRITDLTKLWGIDY